MGSNQLSSNLNQTKKIEEFSLNKNEIYSINILLSTGEGKPKPGEIKTTVFKKYLDTTFNLRLKASRAVFNEINHKFQYFPFTLRSFQDVIKARLAMNELAKQGVVEPFPVLFEKPDKLVAQKRYIVLLLPDKTLKLAHVSDSAMHIEGSNKTDKDFEMEEVSQTPTPIVQKSRKRNLDITSEMEGVTLTNPSQKANSKRKKQ